MGFKDKFKNVFGSGKNFKYLDDLIHSGVKEIVLDSDITLSGSEKSKYSDGIEIDVDDIVIDGNGYGIDAKGKARIFYCTGKNITIKNITLKNGFSKWGGAIYNSGKLTLVKSTLAHNSAAYAGGAVNNSEELTIIESTFMNNEVNGSDGGGAVYNSGSKLSVIKSTFTANMTKYDGGAIHNHKNAFFTKLAEFISDNNTSIDNSETIHENCDGEFTIVESTFADNSSRYGGAVSNDNGNLTITKSVFTNNSAESGGGVHNKTELTIVESAFTGNSAKYNGGAIRNHNGTLTITESIFNNNSSKHNGGVICNEYGGELVISESRFTNNILEYGEKGGVIENREGNVKIFNCEVSDNKARSNIIKNGDSLNVHNSFFTSNQAENIICNDGKIANLGVFGGKFRDNNISQTIVFACGKFCTIEKSVFENVLSDSQNIINKSSMTLTGLKITGNGESILNEGYVLVKNSSPDFSKRIHGEGDVEVDTEMIPKGETFDFGYLDNVIHQGSAKPIALSHDISLETYERDFYEGGIELDIDHLIIDGEGHTIDGAGKSRIFIVSGSYITLKNIIFKNGYSHRDYDNPLNANGGAIKINHDIKLTIENCKFINNTSEENGGAIRNDGELSIVESAFSDNISEQGYGGAIDNGCGATIIKSPFIGNAARYGGAIHNEGMLSIAESAISDNSAEYGEGGAIHNVGELSITESAFTDNSAESGGAILNKDVLLIEKSKFNKNASNTSGGAIRNYEGELVIRGSSLEENTADLGGAISNNDNSIINESSLERNIANTDGGAIRNSNKLTITGCTLTDNSAQFGDGGAVYNFGGKLTKALCIFNNNHPNDVSFKDLMDWIS